MTGHEHTLEIVHRSAERRACVEAALVLRAVGITCDIGRDGREHVVIVRAEDAGRALAELGDYVRENRDAAASAGPTITIRTDGWAGVFAYGAVILLAAICRDRDVFGLDWLSAGMTNAGLIRDGEWWRTVTALTLHADPAHLLANLVIGGLFGLFAAQLLGGGLAWFGILLGGAAGNGVNALLRPAEHTSIGASTAIFAALGIVSAWAWMQRRTGRAMSMARWTPLISGLILLGYLGAGGERTDVLAHVAGFGSGLVLGVICARLRLQERCGPRTQTILGVAALAILVLSWGLALTRATPP